MLCENCGRNTATVYLKNNINGNISETRLCQNCAGKNNINLFENSLNNFDLFNAINFGQLSPGYNAERKVCALCGTAFAQIAQSGKIGCGDCYSEFKAELEPTIIKIHGKAKHTGKIPANLESKISLKRKAEELNTRLKKMIESQNFEEAAVIRDEIISLNQEV